MPMATSKMTPKKGSRSGNERASEGQGHVSQELQACT